MMQQTIDLKYVLIGQLVETNAVQAQQIAELTATIAERDKEIAELKTAATHAEAVPRPAN